MKVPAVLALVGGRFRGKARAPKGAFDVSEAWRVGAVFSRVHGGVSLEIDVEGGADVDSVAQRRASRDVISGKSVKTQVAVGAG